MTALSALKPSGIAFRGDAVAGGRTCVVKAAPPGGFMRSFAAYQSCAGLPFVPKLLIPEVLSIRGWDILCLEYLTGEKVGRIEQLDEARFRSLICSYPLFSQALARVANQLPASGGDTADRLWAYLEATSRRSVLGRLALAGVLSLDPASCRLGADERRVIHNDFHIGNLAFRGTELAAIYDLENIDFGMPCEDIVYLFAYQYSGSGVSRVARRRLRNLMACVVAEAPWPREDWQLAIRRCRMKMAAGVVSVRRGRVSFGRALRLWRLDRRLVELAEVFV